MTDNPVAPRDPTYPAALTTVPPEGLSELRDIVEQLDDREPFGYGEEPEEIARDNRQRAGIAAQALLAYGERVIHGGDELAATMFSDLLGDLMHLADLLGLDFDAKVGEGRFHYEAELRGVL